MAEGGFGARRKSLEDEFFLKRDQELLQALRERLATQERRQALADALGIADEQLLDQLDELDVSAETLAALALVPPIAVAWADGKLDERERQAVLDAAAQQGLEAEHPGYGLLERWLKQKPEARLMDAWKAHVVALSQTLSEPARNTLKQDLLGRARAVAEATGGLLGFGNKVSKTEQAMLDKLEEAFG